MKRSDKSKIAYRQRRMQAAQARIHGNPNLISSVARTLSSALSMRGIKHVLEHPVDYFSLDLAWPEIKLGIECDGPFHMNPKSWARDKRRDAYLTAKGWKIVRFNNTEIQRDLWGVVKKIEKEINDRKSES